MVLNYYVCFEYFEIIKYVFECDFKWVNIENTFPSDNGF